MDTKPFLSGHNPHARTYGRPTEARPMPPRDDLNASLAARPWHRVEVRVGQEFGALTVEQILPPDGNNNGNWCVCRCACGRLRKVLAWRLLHADNQRSEVLMCKPCGERLLRDRAEAARKAWVTKRLKAAVGG